MYTTIYYVVVETLHFFAEDAHFDIIVENILEKMPQWVIDPMCDTHNVVTRPVPKQRISIVPTDKEHNYFEDYKTKRVTLDNKDAFLFIEAMKLDDHPLMWFAKDRLSYMSKHHKLI